MSAVHLVPSESYGQVLVHCCGRFHAIAWVCPCRISGSASHHGQILCARSPVRNTRQHGERDDGTSHHDRYAYERLSCFGGESLLGAVLYNHHHRIVMLFRSAHSGHHMPGIARMSCASLLCMHCTFCDLAASTDHNQSMTLTLRTQACVRAWVAMRAHA